MQVIEPRTAGAYHVGAPCPRIAWLMSALALGLAPLAIANGGAPGVSASTKDVAQTYGALRALLGKSRGELTGAGGLVRDGELVCAHPESSSDQSVRCESAILVRTADERVLTAKLVVSFTDSRIDLTGLMFTGLGREEVLAPALEGGLGAACPHEESRAERNSSGDRIGEQRFRFWWSRHDAPVVALMRSTAGNEAVFIGKTEASDRTSYERECGLKQGGGAG